MRRALVILLLPALLAACARGEARPSGITERWLQAVSDRGRDGLREDAGDRIEEYGTAEAADEITPPDAEEDERTFSDLEVGKATIQGDTARVPFRVTARLEGDERRELRATAALARHGNSWRVVEVVERGAAEEVPSEGGERPASSTPSQWALALLLGVLMTVGAMLVIERQPHPESRH
ncbi:MAG TPA: hypothetical protein VHF47_00115 [Acidimicrobiales bacterium]|nr:hypothetical protein [Acidimicrobiales bacterium]